MEKASTSEKLIFRAVLPSIGSAVMLHGDGGARIKLDVSEEDIEAVLALRLLYVNRVFRVVIEPEV